MGATSKHNRGLLGLLACALALCLVLVGCGGSGSSSGTAATTTADPSTTYVGTWEIVELTSDGTATSTDDLNTMKALGLNVTLSFFEDKTCVLDLMGTTMSGTWEAKDTQTVTITLEGTPIDASLADSKLTFEAEGDKMTFSKTSDTPTTPTAEESTTEEEAVVGDIQDATPIGTVVADDDYCTIEVVSSGTDFTDDPGYTIKVTNKSDVAIYVTSQTGTFSVNGKMIEPVLSITVQPGKYGESFMYFDKTELGGGTEALVGVEGTLVCYDDATWDEYGSYPMSL